MPECVAQRLCGDPIDIVSQNGMERPLRPVNRDPDDGFRVAANKIRVGELLAECRQRDGEILGVNGRGAQILYSVTSFRQRLGRLIDRGLEPPLGLGGPVREHVVHRLKRNTRP